MTKQKQLSSHHKKIHKKNNRKPVAAWIKRNAVYIATTLVTCAFLLAAACFDWDSINHYTAYNNASRSYVKGRVLSVDAEQLETDANDSSRYLGEQEISVEILEGELAGQTVEIDNYLSQTHNIYVKKGQKVIVCADTPENATPYYTIYNYDRTIPVVLLVFIFALSMLFVGKGKGLRALLGVTFTLFAVVLFMVQAIYHGFSPVMISVITVLIGTAVSLLLLNGISMRTFVGGLATMSGVAVTGIIFYISAKTLHLTGFNEDEAEELLLISSATGLSIRNILLAGVLVSALGAVMDVAVSLTAALSEILAVDPTISRRQMMQSGMNIGKDMIGTMSNTLILAFAGSSLTTMLSLTAYGISRMQLLSSDFLALELAQGICATIGVILSVPITTAICAVMFISKDKLKE